MIDFDARFSRRVLLRMVLLLLAAAALGTGSLGFVDALYLQNQLTETGLIINGAILLLFVLGLGKIVLTLKRYAREESALARMLKRLEADAGDPLEGVPADSIAAQRYRILEALSRRHTPANHSALASMLLAGENTRLSFPRFINNILILTGVFGTIVSLSIALVGASDLLAAIEDPSNMGLVIHGMSTALSTTITAIVCYVFFGYFYLKLTDAKTHLVNGVEQVTAFYLLPRFAHDTESIAQRVVGLLRGLQQITDTLRSTQEHYAAGARELRDAIASIGPGLGELGGDLDEIRAILREGFRLPAPPRREAGGAAASPAPILPGDGVAEP